MFKAKRWSSKTLNTLEPIELAMMVLSFFSVIIVLALAFGKLDKETYRLLLYIDGAICFIFMSRFFWGLYKARDKS